MGSITKGADPRETLWFLRVAAAVVVLAAVSLTVRWAMREQLEPKAAAAILRSVQGDWWVVPAFCAVYVGATALFLPAVLFNMLSGATWGFGAGLAVNLVAVNGSASLHFLLARKLGRGFFTRLLPARQLALFDGVAERHGVRAVIGVRVLPLPHMAVNVAAGVSAMRWRDFALGSAVGTLPVLVIYTYFAAALVEGVVGAEQRAIVHSVIAGALVLTATWGPRALAWLRTRRERVG